MSIKFFYLIFLVCPICLIISSCSKVKKGEYDGKIVYVNGTDRIKFLDLKTLESGIIYTENEIVAGILNIKKIDNNLVLFSFSEYGIEPTIKKLNLDNKTVEFYYSGENPFLIGDQLFLYEHKKELFILSLDQVSLKDTSVIKTKIADYQVNKRLANIVKLPDNSVIYNDPDDYLTKYDPVNKRKKKLSFKGYYPLFYNSNDNLLYCSTHVFRISDSSEELVTIDIANNEKNDLGVYVSENVVFIEPYNSLIYGNPTFSLKYGETTDLYILNLNSLQEKKLITDVSFSDAVYIGNE